MIKDEIVVVLQACVFAMGGISEQDVCALGYNPRIVRIGFRLYDRLQRKDVLKGGHFDELN